MRDYWKGGVGSLGGYGGERRGRGHGGRGLEWMEGLCTTTTTLHIGITNSHEPITVCQKRWGVDLAFPLSHL